MLKLSIAVLILILLSGCTSQKTKCINPQEYGGYAYCTPPVKLLKSDDCQKLYGKEWSDTGGGKCQKEVPIPEPDFYYYPKSENDCFVRGMKPRKAANGSLICHKLDDKGFDIEYKTVHLTDKFEEIVLLLCYAKYNEVYQLESNDNIKKIKDLNKYLDQNSLSKLENCKTKITNKYTADEFIHNLFKQGPTPILKEMEL